VLSRYLFLNVVQSVPVLFTLNAADAILILGVVSARLAGPLPTVSVDKTGLSLEGLNEWVSPAPRKLEAAQAMGASTWDVLSRYLFLNVVQSVPVLFTLNAADAILILGGLGFLGLGLPEQTPEWGADIRQALDALPTGIWWTALFPGLALTLMVTGLSLVGEGLNEWVNPLLRRENWK
jgi:hypothetical protein